MEYSPSEAAKLAGVNKSTVLRAVRSGKLSASRHTDGSFTIDASELARVYDLHHLPEAMPRGASAAPPATRGASGSEAAVLRARLEAAEVQAARDREERERERETAEAQLARERETVADLRRRLDRAEERVLALTVQPAPQPAPEPSAVVEELRRRLQESEARNQVLSAAVAPQWPEERLSESPAQVTSPKGARGFLGRLLGR